MTVTAPELDEAAATLARWLAPYIQRELDGSAPRTAAHAEFDEAVAAEFVRALGDTVVDNAIVFFDVLARDGEASSLRIAEALGVGSPRNIAAGLTTPLKRRAKALGLQYPWIDDTRGERTLWIDREGRASIMLGALQNEKARREGHQ